jgi:transposase, IS5 family
MIPTKMPYTPQLSFLYPRLSDLLDTNFELCLLAREIGWNYFEEEFNKLYSPNGRPGLPIRLMVSLLLLKHIYNLSDESLVEQQWVMNPYFQYFSGCEFFQTHQPCAASELVHFRNRIGEEGVQKILKHSIDKHGDDAKEKTVSIDTTVQEKNITFPTDAKLHKKIVDRIAKIRKIENLPCRRSYTKTLKTLIKDQHNANHPKRKKKANAARKKLKTIAARVVREFERNASEQQKESYKKELDIFNKVLTQTKNSSNKIYSLHEPEVYCMSKGKAHKQYEFGCKASITITQNTNIIVGAMTFKTNKYDGHTLDESLEQTKELIGVSPKIAYVDRGYRGKNIVGTTKIERPQPPKKTDTNYKKSKARKGFRRRAAIEPKIGHLKSDHRVNINYLKGQIGDTINFVLAASACNFKSYMKKLSKAFLCPLIKHFIKLKYNSTKFLSDLETFFFVAKNQIKISNPLF